MTSINTDTASLSPEHPIEHGVRVISDRLQRVGAAASSSSERLRRLERILIDQAAHAVSGSESATRRRSALAAAMAGPATATVFGAIAMLVILSLGAPADPIHLALACAPFALLAGRDARSAHIGAIHLLAITVAATAAAGAVAMAAMVREPAADIPFLGLLVAGIVLAAVPGLLPAMPPVTRFDPQPDPASKHLTVRIIALILFAAGIAGLSNLGGRL